MKKRKIILSLVIALTLISIIGATVATAASIYGTREDPLVSLSYINDRLTPDILSQVSAEIHTRASQLQTAIDNASEQVTNFTLINVSAGQRLNLTSGAEFILRSGNATCVTGSEMINVTSGSSIYQNDSIAANNLYMASASGDGFYASNDVSVMVRGSYTIS
jgi:hypothetical protein